MPRPSVEFVHGVVRQGPEFLPDEIGLGGWKELVHRLSFLFADVTALLSAAGFGGQAAGAGVEPAGQRRMPHQARRFASRVGDHRLGHILRGRRIAIDLTERRRIDQADVLPDQLGSA